MSRQRKIKLMSKFAVRVQRIHKTLNIKKLLIAMCKAKNKALVFQ